MKYKIIADSSCDLRNDYLKQKYNSDEIGLEIIPFVITTDGKDFVDDENINIQDMLATIKKSKTTSSSCPAPFLYETACSAENNFIVTISAKLSGSYNSACVAQNNSKNKVFVVDSKGTAGLEQLIVDKLYELASKNLEFDAIKEEITKFRDGLTLYFTLSNYDNLVRKGRIKLLIAKIITAVSIKTLCKANDGEIEVEKKFLTFNQCTNWIDKITRKTGKDLINRDCIITYCGNDEIAKKMKVRFQEGPNGKLFKDVIISQARGLDSFYALENSIIVSF